MPKKIVGKENLKNLKKFANIEGFQCRIKVGQPPLVWLRPVATTKEVQDENDVRCLTDWRNRFGSSFLNEFVATYDQTSEWLSNTVGTDDNRILFMIDCVDNFPIGFMGLAFIDWRRGYAEADSVVRGVNGRKGVMSMGLRTMIKWSKEQLGLQTIGVRVRSDNPALEFYRKFGFVEQKRTPLSKQIQNNKITWIEDPDNQDSQLSIVQHILFA